MHEGRKALCGVVRGEGCKEKGAERNFLFLLSASSLCLLNGRYIVCVLFPCYPEPYQQFTFCVNVREENVSYAMKENSFFNKKLFALKLRKSKFLVLRKVFFLSQSFDNKLGCLFFENNVLERIKPRA